MLRDQLRNEKYFREYIRSEEENIEEFEELVEQVKKERGENDPGIRSGYNFLFGSYFNKLVAMYSLGISIEEIKLFFKKVVDITEKSWNAESKYVEMIWLLSIGNLLEIGADQMERLKKLIEEDGVEDYLIDYLINAYDNTWKIRNHKFKFVVPYQSLYQVIHAESSEKSISTLKKYLESEWYNGHRDTGWYDTHKHADELIYSGYWSFESAAIVKNMGLNDSSLKEVPYYPYDMIHYKEG